MPDGRRFFPGLSILLLAIRHFGGGQENFNLRRPEMSRAKGETGQATELELERVIEPLASYICAADQPRAVLMAALAALFSEVDQIYRAANAQITIFSGNPSS
jgi:hypothetical protein